MTNWKQFTITKINDNDSYFRFKLNDYVNYSNGRYNHVDTKKVYPFNSLRYWDEIEIDLNRSYNFSSGYEFPDTDVVRKYRSNDNSMALISSSNREVYSSVQNEGTSRLSSFATMLNRSGRTGEGTILQANTDGDFRAETVQYDGKNWRYENYRTPR